MADVFGPEKRSEVMALIKGKDTKAEKIVFRYLRANKIHFQKHYKRVAGKPDIAVPRKKKAVFIDGDFWHGKTYEQLKLRRPEGDYWLVKIARNMERDKEQEKLLIENGWQFMRVWEEDILRLGTREDTLLCIAGFISAAGSV